MDQVKAKNGFIHKNVEEDMGEENSECTVLPLEKNIKNANETPTQMKNETINPFIHRFSLNSTYNYFKLAFMSVFVLPLRILMIIVCLIVTYIISSIGMYGISREEHKTVPMAGWRRILKDQVCQCVRILYIIFGFHYVRVKGQHARAKEAPILVMAPHSSMFDALPVVVVGAPSIIAKGEVKEVPFFAKFIDFTQPVYVWREDTNSRQNTISEIRKRVTSDQDWPQIIIFPEGTCTNRSCLITYKPGAFYPGVPVQPVVLRYPNKTDCITWTWDGPGALKIIWTTLCQFHNYCELEYLPVYNPSPEEINDPHLYAQNVRKVMADALGVPVMDYTYDDCRVMHKAKLKNLPCETGLVRFYKLRQKYGLTLKEVEGDLLNKYASMALTQGHVTLQNFSDYMGIPKGKLPLLKLFDVFDQDERGVMNYQNFLIGLCQLRREMSLEENVNEAFRFFIREEKEKIWEEEFVQILEETLSVEKVTATKLFKCMDAESKGFLTLENFKAYAKSNPEYIKIFLEQMRVCEPSSFPPEGIIGNGSVKKLSE